MTNSVHRTRRSNLLVAGLVALFAILAMFVGASAASAAPTSSTPTTGGYCNVSGTGASVSDKRAAAADDNLPINRWGDSASGPIHTKIDTGSLGLSNLSQRLQRQGFDNGALSVGDAMWGVSTTMTEYADRFCVADSVGYSVDKLAAKVGAAFLSSGLVAGAVVIAMFLSFWRAFRRSQSPWGAIGKHLAALGLLATLIHGATATTTTGGHTSFGVMGPGWIATRVNLAVSTLSQQPIAAMANASNSLSGLVGNTPDNTISCPRYVTQLLKNYDNSYKGSPGEVAAAAVPRAMDAMWEHSGLIAFAHVQFGTNNPYGEQIYCHLLELNSNHDQTPIFQQIAPNSAKSLNDASMALGGDGSNNHVDRMMIGYAACLAQPDGSWKVVPIWAQTRHTVGGTVSDDTYGGETPGDCANWWHQNTSDWDSGSTAMNWDEDAGYINSATRKAPTIKDFMLNFHGMANQSATTIAIVFALASLFVIAIFGLLAAAVIMAKVMLLILTLMSIFALVADIVISGGGSQQSRLAMMAKTYLGTVFFAFGSSMLLGLIAIMSGFMVGVSTGIGGAGSLVNVVWTGLAPVLAVLSVNWIFKHVLKAPSPFKMTAGSAWGAAAGGAALGAGLQAWHDRSMMRGRRAMRRSANAAGRRFTGRAPATFMDEGGRIHGMPSTSGRRGPGTAAAAGAAVGAAAGAAAGTAGASGSGAVGAGGGLPPGAKTGRFGNVRMPNQRQMAKLGRDQMFAERGIGKNPIARLGNTMGRAWDRTTATQKATSALKIGALAAGAAAIPVMLPASLVGMGVARAALRRHSAMKNGTNGIAARQRHADQMSAYNRALAAQRASESVPDGGIAPAMPSNGSTNNPAPVERVDTMPQATVDATGRAMGPSAGGAAPAPRMPYQYGPGGSAPTRRAAPRVAGQRTPRPSNPTVAGTGARVSAARRAARNSAANTAPLPRPTGNSPVGQRS